MKILICLLSLMIVAFSAYSAANAKAPSFDCAKARMPIEKMICGYAELTETDAELAAVFAKIRDGYDAKRRKSLIAGQRTWLKLRVTACSQHDVLDEDDDTAACVLSVYDERLKELRQQVERRDDGSAEIDLILDTSRNLSAYAPESMSALHYSKADETVGDERIPRTCRELYTLTAGRWRHGVDNIGMNSDTWAFANCKFALFSAQRSAREPMVGNTPPFDDLMQFSTEFLCLALACADNDFKEKIRTLRQEVEAGGLRIISDRLPLWEAATDATTLAVDARGIYFQGTNYIINASQIGDFTGQGRAEMLLIITGAPSQGTFRDINLVLAYYDSKTRSIRPERIDDSRRITLISPTSP